MKEIIYKLLVIAFLIPTLQLPVFAEGDCILDEAGVCQEGECRLEDGEIGVCRQSGDDCVCSPNN
ncbi:MAG: hypothetical protein HYY52_04150 [Candidatus Melainabacteria bacterium]|nr:hypothetical protein [Candidatus Melainabacteria bacterium]